MGEAPTRRERYRQQTLADIKAAAMQQVEAGGVESVSLNAIARALAVSPPALYRYFPSRDDLLAELVVDSYGSLADAMEEVDHAGTPARRFAVVAEAYRAWAVASPNAYRLVFHHSTGSGQDLARDRVVAAAQRSMDVFLEALAAVGPTPDRRLDRTLRHQVTAWGHRSGTPDLPPARLELALVCWSRLHGLISLELGGHLGATGVDPALLYRAEVRALLDEARPRSR